MKPDISISERIPRLREYYLTHAPMAVDRNMVPWKCQRTLSQYVRGWLESGGAPTVRIRRSMAEAYVLRNMKPVIFPGDLIAGQPDLSPIREDERERYDADMALRGMLPALRGRADHLAMDYTRLLEEGVTGVIEDLKKERDSLDLFDGRSAEDYEYFECCIIELEGVLELAAHYAAEAGRLAAEASDAREKAELDELAAVLCQVPAHPARTFREALQSIHLFTFSLFGIYSAGRPDQYLLPYYRRDISSGVLTEAGAQELVDCFCIQYIANMSQWAAAGFMLGGRDGEGNPVENELTWHFLAAASHVHAPDPNIGLCVTDATSPELLRFAVQTILNGHGQPQIWNNDAVTRSMRRCGYADEASNLFTHSTCVEITPIGASGVSITSPYINVLGIFLKAFETCPDDCTFEELFGLFDKEFRAYWKRAFLQENLWQVERGRNSTDPMRISPFIHDCGEKRRSNDCGGARYNFLEPNLLGMTNTIECLNVVRELVYERRALTIPAFRQALADNYAGHEELLHTIRYGVTHFGVGDAKTDALAKRVSDLLLGIFSECTTVRGAKVIPGAFSYRDHAAHGSHTGASPDGRLAGMPLADGSGPVQGYDDCGPTLSLVSTTAWEPARFLGGTSVNIKLDRRTPPEKLTALIKGYLKTEGAQLQFNIVDPDELLDAKAHPEAHRDLIVRIGGYSDFFVRLPETLQNDVISRAQNGV